MDSVGFFGFGFGGSFGYTGGSFVANPAGPSAFSNWSAVAGGNSGEVTITIGALPAGGDTTVAGNGLGAVSAIQWKPHTGDTWQTLANGTALGARTVTYPFLPGEIDSVDIRALGYLGRDGAVATSAGLTVPGTPVFLIHLYAADEITRLYSAAELKLEAMIPDV